MLAGFLRYMGAGVKGVDRARQGEGEQDERDRVEGIGVKVQGEGAVVARVVAQAKRRRPLWVRTRVT